MDTERMEPPAQSPSNGFESLGLSHQIIAALADMNIVRPTAFQTVFFPALATGRAILARADREDGKLLAYCAHIIQSLAGTPKDERTTVGAALIAPNRDFVKLINKRFYRLNNAFGLTAASARGGSDLKREAAMLTPPVDVVIGATDGICEHLREKTLSFDSLKYIVFDGIDEMLNANLIADIEFLVRLLPPRCRILFLVTELTDSVRQLADRLLFDPIVLNHERRRESSRAPSHPSHTHNRRPQRDAQGPAAKPEVEPLIVAVPESLSQKIDDAPSQQTDDARAEPALSDQDLDADALPVISPLFDDPFPPDDEFGADRADTDNGVEPEDPDVSTPPSQTNGKPGDRHRSQRRSFGRRQDANIQLNDSHAAFGSDGEIETFGGPFLSVSDAEEPSYNQEIAGTDWFIWEDEDGESDPAPSQTASKSNPAPTDEEESETRAAMAVKDIAVQPPAPVETTPRVPAPSASSRPERTNADIELYVIRRLTEDIRRVIRSLS